MTYQDDEEGAADTRRQVQRAGDRSATQRVLFADPDHGPRSQMAEALMRAMDWRGDFEASSAGTDPGADLSEVAKVLAEIGVTFTQSHRALNVAMAPDLLLVVCEEGCAACPYLPGARRIERWPMDDPADLQDNARTQALRTVRQQLVLRIGVLLEPTSAPRTGHLRIRHRPDVRR